MLRYRINKSMSLNHMLHTLNMSKKIVFGLYIRRLIFQYILVDTEFNFWWRWSHLMPYVFMMAVFYFCQGFVQFVESVAVAEVLNLHTGIQNFFKICAPCENTSYGFQPEVMDNFVKSCGKGLYKLIINWK